jgi:hypothetical protein
MNHSLIHRKSHPEGAAAHKAKDNQLTVIRDMVHVAPQYTPLLMRPSGPPIPQIFELD